MELLFFIGGVVTGFVISLVMNSSSKTHGVIKVDHRNESCSVHMTSDDLLKRSTKKAIFIVDHNANLSRD